jgi:hypothetical protein
MFAVSLAALAGFSLLAGDNAENQATADPSAPAVAINQPQPAATVKPAQTNAASPALARPATMAKTVSYETAQVAKLAQTGVDPSVIKAYVENSQIATPPTVDEIIYLRNQGIPSDTIAALIRRGNLLQAQSIQNMQATQATAPQGPTTAPAPVYVNTAPAQNPVYDYSQLEPNYTYAAYPPYYYNSWPYYYGWSSGIYYSSYPYGRFGYRGSYPGYRNYASLGHPGFNQRGRDFGRPGFGNHGSWGGGTPRPGGWSGGTPRPGGWSGGTPRAGGWSGGTSGGGPSSHRGR